MSVLPNSETKTKYSIHPATRIGYVSLNVANLENQLAFYQQALGFHLHWRDGNKAGLGGGNADLLQLVEQPDYKRYQRVTGLYHFAVLFPDRRELARAIARLFVLKYPNSPTDHIMTKTTYLDDMEGNGIELYTESPEDGTWTMKNGTFETRRADGSWSDGREPLHVRDVNEALDFYHGLIGFDIMGNAKNFRMGFVSAGGYHHHIGLNTWQGE